MSDKIVHDKASEVDANEGVVSVEGPDDVDVKLTPNAAAETSDRLLVGSMKAQGQKLQEEKRKKRSPV